MDSRMSSKFVFFSNVPHKISTKCFLLVCDVSVCAVNSGECFCSCLCAAAEMMPPVTMPTSFKASVQLHSCGGEDILIGSFFCSEPTDIPIRSTDYCCGRWGTGSPGGRVNHQVGSGQLAQLVTAVVGSGKENSCVSAIIPEKHTTNSSQWICTSS